MHYAGHMPATIQIRNVPDALHRRLKSRAALAGMSLSAYLLDHLRALADQPTIEELRARLERLPPLHPLRVTGPGGPRRTRSPVIVVGVSVPMAVRGRHASVD